MGKKNVLLKITKYNKKIYSAPTVINLEMTEACNVKCRHCYNPWREEHAGKFNLDNNITPETIIKSIDEIMITTSVAGEDIEEKVSVSDKIKFNEMTKAEKEMILLDLDFINV